MRRAFGRTGVDVPVIGQGSWQLGQAPAQEAAALRRGVELGLTHLDTAELYGPGEDVVGRVVRELPRERLFLVSKVVPQNADRKGTVAACRRSLAKLGTDHLDVYLLHWQGSFPLAESMRGLRDCLEAGLVRAIGVSNLDVPELEECLAALGDVPLACNQVYYDLAHRGVERRLLPWCQEREIALVGYSPFGSAPARIPGSDSPGGRVLAEVAAAHGVSAAQVILAFLTRLPGTFTIPRATRLPHVEQNAAALQLRLTPDELARIDAAFPAPDRDVPLASL